MDVILLEKIERLGGLGDVVSVKPGYARNFLLPSGKAKVATEVNVQELEARRAELEKLAAEAQAVPMELEIDRISAVTRNLREGDQDDKEFERRMRVAETLLKERQIKGKENVNGQRTNGTPRPSQPAPPAQMEPPRGIRTQNGGME